MIHLLNKHTSVIASLAGTLLISSTAGAQNFSYPDFSSIAGLSLVQQAQQMGTTLRVHDMLGTAGANRGAVWYDTTVNVAGGFSSTFEFQITGAGSGDGMAFVIQNESTPGTAGGVGVTGIGTHAAALGYGLFTTSPVGASLENSVAIEIDTYANGNWGDLNDNHISIHSSGVNDNSQDESFSIGRTATGALPNLNDGLVHTMQILYVPGTLEVRLDGSSVLTAPFTFAVGGTYLSSGSASGALNLAGGTNAWVGITASSGGSVQNHDVLSWDFSSGSPGGTSLFCSPASNHSGGLSSSLGTSDFSGPGLFHVAATDGPVDQFGYFLVSATPVDPGVSVSNGQLCLGAPIGRYSPASSAGLNSIGRFDAAGIFQNLAGTSSVGSGFDIPALLPDPPGGLIGVGETWHFQLWVRDGANSNFSDGISVAF
jgi:hypothetical protein